MNRSGDAPMGRQNVLINGRRKKNITPISQGSRKIIPHSAVFLEKSIRLYHDKDDFFSAG